MALQTETLYEYLQEGGNLPSSFFALMGENFEQLFIGRYAALEIGFETPNLFEVRLTNKAAIVCPEYAKRLSVLDSAFTGLSLLKRYQSETRTYGKMESSNETSGTNTDLPFDAETAKPSSKSSMEGTATTEEHTDELSREESMTPDELKRLYEEFSGRAFSIIQSCLDEFKPLFLGVY